ncbi:hypothetical protein, partial [Enterobacter sp. EC_62]
SLNRLIRCVCGKKIGPDPRNFNQRVSLGRNDLLIRTFPSEVADLMWKMTTKTDGKSIILKLGDGIKKYWSNIVMNTKGINTRDDFIKFLENLSSNSRNNLSEWESKDLPSYFESMASWVEDMDGYYLNQKLPVPENVNWTFIADILMAARVYE